jgi:hypothetical protein
MKSQERQGIFACLLFFWDKNAKQGEILLFIHDTGPSCNYMG